MTFHCFWEQGARVLQKKINGDIWGQFGRGSLAKGAFFLHQSQSIPQISRPMCIKNNDDDYCESGATVHAWATNSHPKNDKSVFFTYGDIPVCLANKLENILLLTIFKFLFKTLMNTFEIETNKTFLSLIQGQLTNSRLCSYDCFGFSRFLGKKCITETRTGIPKSRFKQKISPNQSRTLSNQPRNQYFNTDLLPNFLSQIQRVPPTQRATSRNKIWGRKQLETKWYLIAAVLFRNPTNGKLGALASVVQSE